MARKKASEIIKDRVKESAELYIGSQPYRLGLVYKQIGETLMNPDTTVTDLARLANRFGLDISMELIPKESGKLSGEKV